jgi:hypothetical protein
MWASFTTYAKRGLLKEPEHPNSVAFTVFALLIGCLIVAVGLFGGFGGWLLPVMWVVLGLYFAVRGIAETLPTRRRRAAVVLRTVAVAIVLATLVYVTVATIAFNV